MERIDISRSRLYVQELIKVIKSGIHMPKTINSFGRHSDCFVYVLTGSCTYTFDDGYTFTVREGDILYLAHRSVYRMDVHSDYNFIFCDFQFKGDEMRRSDVFTPKASDTAENTFRRLYKCYTDGLGTAFTDCMSMLYAIYGVVMASAMGEGETVESIAAVKAYIDASYMDTAITVTSLAERSGVSEVYFRKLFKKQYGVSPSKYIEAVRLEGARQLMKYSFVTVEECALQSGFTSVQYFCRVFKRVYGQTPGEYRRSM